MEGNIPEQLTYHDPTPDYSDGTNRYLIWMSRAVSAIFTPFMAPLLTFAILFFFSYLKIFPLQYKLYVLGMVYAYTILFPMLAIYIYQKLIGQGIKGLKQREQRFVPYLFTLLSYGACLFSMYRMSMQRFMIGIILSTIICMLLCALCNLRWKISVHTASCGMMVGFLLSFGLLFHFNPIYWLCGFILLSGLLGSARIILRHHSLLEVGLGFFVGLFCGIISFLLV